MMPRVEHERRDAKEPSAKRQRREREAQEGHPEPFDVVDEAGEESFPASDPPCFTPGHAG